MLFKLKLACEDCHLISLEEMCPYPQGNALGISQGKEEETLGFFTDFFP